MMYTKNFRLCVISALIALQNQTSFQHSFSNSCKNWIKRFFCSFSYAFHRTIFSFLRQSTQKSNATMQAMVLSFAFFAHCFVIAIRATIFGLVDPARNVCKLRPTFSAIGFYLHPRMKCHARPAAKQGSVFSVIGYSKCSFTMNANFFMPNTGTFYATH